MRVEQREGTAIRSFRDLIVWQKAIELARETYLATANYPREETYGLTSQMRRAAVSVASNIAEGQARETRGEFIQFLGHARGSLAELETQTILSAQLEFLVPDSEVRLMNSISEVGRLLSGLRNSLKQP